VINAMVARDWGNQSVTMLQTVPRASSSPPARVLHAPVGATMTVGVPCSRSPRDSLRIDDDVGDRARDHRAVLCGYLAPSDRIPRSRETSLRSNVPRRAMCYRRAMDVSSLRSSRSGTRPSQARFSGEHARVWTGNNVADEGMPAGSISRCAGWATAPPARRQRVRPRVCQPPLYAPWDPRWLGRALFSRRALAGQLPLVRAFGTMLLRARSRPAGGDRSRRRAVINRPISRCSTARAPISSVSCRPIIGAYS